MHRSSDFWFSDGSIVLQTEDTQFRVHGGLLTHHSQVFKDVLDIPQPGKPAEPQVDGCPVVILYDDTDDVHAILSILYNNISAYDAQGPVSASTIVGMLRLGKKYGIDYLWKEGLRRFRADYPINVQEWQPGKRFIHGDPKVYQEKLINIAHDSLYLACVSGYTFDGLVVDPAAMDSDLEHDTNTKLSAEVLQSLLMGRNNLVGHLWRAYLKYSPLIHTKSEQYFGGCEMPRVCKTDRLRLFNSFDFWKEPDGYSTVLAPWKYPSTFSLCARCTKSFHNIYDIIREDAWKAVPKCYNLGQWEDLEDAPDYDIDI